MKKVYVFDTEAQAEAFRMTAYYFGWDITRVGSAVIVDEAIYKDVLEKTRAIPAAIVAVEVKEAK